MKNQRALELAFHQDEKRVKGSGFREVDCEITREDFDAMTYFCDSGMFDISTQNAASLALRRKVKGGRVSVSKKGRKGAFVCRIGGESFPLSGHLDEFFSDMERGIFREGFHFKVLLPKEFVQ